MTSVTPIPKKLSAPRRDLDLIGDGTNGDVAFEQFIRSPLMSFSWIRRIFQRPIKTIRRPVPSSNKKKWTAFRPNLESLEDRTMPAFLLPATFDGGINP